MAGYPEGTSFDEKYKPRNPVTRAQFASLISAANLYWQIPEIDRRIQFKDIGLNHWANKAIALAVRTGFLSGYEDGSFRPDENIPRQQVLVALAGGLGLAKPTDIAGVLRRYQDADRIAAWAKPGVAAAIQAGLMIDSAPTLEPQKQATRGETAVLISQSLKLQLESFEQPAPDPDDSSDSNPMLRIVPQTEDITLVQVDTSEETGAVVINNLTARIKVIAKPDESSSETEASLNPGQRYTYSLRDGSYQGEVSKLFRQ
jgi:hypothetical protein